MKHSSRAKTLLKKQPPIRGPKVLQDAWDSKKTVRQNYAALGLAASFKPQASGGVEGAKTRKGLNEDHDITTSGEPSTSTRQDTKKGVPKGHARIIRDSDGNVVGIEEAEAEDEEMEESESDQLIEDKASRLDPDTMEWVTMGRETGKELSETTVVQALEETVSSLPRPNPRSASSSERMYLERLVSKYGQDIDAMARDRKLNPTQFTVGQLGRAIRKSGGFAKFGVVS